MVQVTKSPPLYPEFNVKVVTVEVVLTPPLVMVQVTDDWSGSFSASAYVYAQVKTSRLVGEVGVICTLLTTGGEFGAPRMVKHVFPPLSVT